MAGKAKARSRLVVLLAISVVALGIAGGIAYATIPDADGVIHACANPGGGAIRVIDTDLGQSCRASEVALDWNRQGRPGVSGLHRVAAMSAIDSENFKDVAADCPDGMRVTGGGFFLGGIAEVRVLRSEPRLDGSGWLVSAIEFGAPAGTDDDWFVVSSALCASAN